MKILVLAPALAAASLCLAGCVGPGAITGAAPSTSVAPAAGFTAADALAAQKEANRHLELCHRTYTFAWPPTGQIDCPGVQPAAAQPAALTPDLVEQLVESAVTKALAAAAAAPK